MANLPSSMEADSAESVVLEFTDVQFDQVLQTFLDRAGERESPCRVQTGHRDVVVLESARPPTRSTCGLSSASRTAQAHNGRFLAA